MSESYTGADFQQQASSSKRRRRPINIAPKNRAILQTESEAAVFSLVRTAASPSLRELGIAAGELPWALSPFQDDFLEFHPPAPQDSWIVPWPVLRVGNSGECKLARNSGLLRANCLGYSFPRSVSDAYFCCDARVIGCLKSGAEQVSPSREGDPACRFGTSTPATSFTLFAMSRPM
jgi:hypothetical protein